MDENHGARAENFAHVWRLYNLDELSRRLQTILLQASAERKWLLRHHREAAVSQRHEIEQRGLVDSFLHACGVLEVGFRAGALEDPQRLCAFRLLPVLGDNEIRAYYEATYPLRLPGRFRQRVDFGEKGTDQSFDPGWFARLLSLDTSFRDERLKQFLNVIDGFWYSDVDFTRLLAAANNGSAIVDAVMTPSDQRSLLQHIIAGLERFILFGRDLADLIDAAKPALGEETFDLYRYWFEVRSSELGRVVDNAISALHPISVLELELPERSALSQLFEMASRDKKHSRTTTAPGANTSPIRVGWRELTKIDDITISVARKSLPARFSEVRERIDSDYVADVGMVPFLRELHYKSDSILGAAQVYWSTRREVASPRLESIMAAGVLNFAADSVLEALRVALLNHPLEAARYLVTKNLSADLVIASGDSPTKRAWEDMAWLAALFRLREGNEESAMTEVGRVVSGASLSIEPSVEDWTVVDALRLNIQSIAVGLLEEVLSKVGVQVLVPRNGLVLKGLPASPKSGWGRKMDLLAAVDARQPFVFADLDADPRRDVRVRDSLSRASAAICTGGMAGHIPIVCRGFGVACVALSEADLRIAARHSWLLVRGDEGEVHCYKDQPDWPAMPNRIAGGH